MRISTLLSSFAFAYSSAANVLGTEFNDFKLKKTYDASNFFDSFDFQGGHDKWTNGFAQYVVQDEATSSGLAKVEGDQVYLGVDHDNKVDAKGIQGRKSVRLESKDEFGQGLLIADFEHLPASACGTWPAFWLLHDPEQGETYSEIDIIEGISLNTQNEISLYTSSSPCNMQANSMTGTARYTDCYRSEEDMDGAVEGCGVEAPSGSFGDASNENGGQVWALLLNDQGAKAWYFEKNKVPADINDGKPNIESWGTPVLDFGAGNCNVKEAWKKLKIILNITFCGDYAGGEAWTGYSNCQQNTGLGACVDFVAQTPQAFKDVYFLINSIKLYQR